MSTTGLRYFNAYGSGENQKGDYASIVTFLLKAKENRESLVVNGDGIQSRDPAWAGSNWPTGNVRGTA